MDLLVRAFVTLSASSFAHRRLLLSFALLSSSIVFSSPITHQALSVLSVTTTSSLGLYLTSIVSIFLTNGPHHSQPSNPYPSAPQYPEAHGSFNLYLTSIVVPSLPMMYPSPLGLYLTSVVIPSPPITHSQVLLRRRLPDLRGTLIFFSTYLFATHNLAVDPHGLLMYTVAPSQLSIPLKNQSPLTANLRT
ncbi:hypothetical protein EDB85DRAFT_2143618 [Lactarius pseudohatsudake]|nr:hypothetical protein EDB85DRAFT_2143618 [Lactarius pseudohatsudake]